MAVAEFASRIFGVTVEPDSVIEESLKRITSNPDIPSADILLEAFNAPVPRTAEELINIHHEPGQKKDRITRQELKDLGYRVIVIRYDQDLEEQIHRYPDVFG